MAPKPKMALVNPLAAATIASGGTAPKEPEGSAAPSPKASATVPAASKQAPTLTERSDSEAKVAEVDRLYVYVPSNIAQAIRVHCAMTRTTQSEFAQAAFARELQHLGVQFD